MSTPTAPSPLRGLADQAEGLSALDDPAKKVGKSVRNALDPGPVKDAVSGSWLGHALHPVLTDVVIGSFLSASILDVIGGRQSAPAARRLVATGLLATGPTALTGLSDWADSEAADPRIRRVGVLHAAANTTAATLQMLSFRARGRGRRATGSLLSAAATGVMIGGAYLGGHMSFGRGVAVNQTAFDTGPTDWSPALEASELADGDLRETVVGETPVILVRSAGRVSALHGRCSHRGCSLGHHGTLGDGYVECGCHGSRFSLDDGTVVRGPASAGQPPFEVRESDGRIEVRLRET